MADGREYSKGKILSQYHDWARWAYNRVVLEAKKEILVGIMCRLTICGETAKSFISRAGADWFLRLFGAAPLRLRAD